METWILSLIFPWGYQHHAEPGNIIWQWQLALLSPWLSQWMVIDWTVTETKMRAQTGYFYCQGTEIDQKLKQLHEILYYTRLYLVKIM